jgi:adenylate cyclase
MNETTSAVAEGRFQVLDLEVDLARQTLRRRGQAILLPELSFRLLAALVRHAPDTIGKDELISEVWNNVIVGDETLSQRVRLLRQALGEDGQDPRYVASVRGRGYRLICPVRELGSSTPPLPRKWWLAVAAAVSIVAAAIWIIAADSGKQAPARTVNSIAVLPFSDLSPDQAYRYFADGMQEELLTRLTKIENLDVASRTSVEKYRSTELGLPAIAQQLGVSTVIESSIRVADDRVRITVQLIDAKTDRHIWAENYDRELTVENIFSIQQDVAERIGQALALEYKASPLSREVPLPTTSLDAYSAYLIGRHHTFLQTPEDLELAVTYLEQATAIDTEFAEAYATLGWAYSFLGTIYGQRPPRDVYPKAKEAAIRALSLDSELANARTLYADILTWFDWDFEAAEREYLKTVALDPLNVLGYALFLSTQLRHEEAIAALEKRIAATPNDPYVRVNAAWGFLHARQYSRAIEEAALAGQHPDARPVLGFAYLATGATDQAVGVLETDLRQQGRKPRQLSNLAVAYFKAGRVAEAQQLLEELQAAADARYFSPDLLADAYFAAGDADSGFKAYQEAVAARARGAIFLQLTPMLDGHREDPRYQALIQAVGFK